MERILASERRREKLKLMNGSGESGEARENG